MSLSRRSLLGLAASLLPGAALATEFTWGKSENSPTVQPDTSGRWDFMRFLLRGNRNFTARQALVLTDAAAYSGSFAGRVMLRDENRIGILRDIPLVGEFFQNRLRGRDFDPTLQVGLAYQAGETLVLDLHRTRITLDTLAQRFVEAGSETGVQSLAMPDSGVTVRTLIAANQTISAHVTAAILSPVTAGSAPAALQQLAAADPAVIQVGEVYRHPEGHLLVLVRPSILTGWN